MKTINVDELFEHMQEQDEKEVEELRYSQTIDRYKVAAAAYFINAELSENETEKIQNISLGAIALGCAYAQSIKAVLNSDC